ncbi:hypothetical protein CC78DRAFT_607827 [Lojkania enalia]|uniref:Uncharacterized protein n=1 Tax=Lojkania enalia TaxID=147567 RepID=A0A9P4N784_9PLEO|nr:hypothetical protein CC78DRAFT_607827 [Didymosphaeria enalia]
MATTKSHTGNKMRGIGCHKQRFLIQSSEAYQLAMHTLNQYRGTIVACRYFPLPILARSESLPTLKTQFCDALARVVLAQPHLQIGIIGENSKNPAFVRLDRLDLRNSVQWITLDDSSYFQELYLETIQAQLDSRYENLSTQPGRRVVVLHEIGAESIEVFQDKEPIVEVSNDSDRWVLGLPDTSDKLPPNPDILTSWPVSPGCLPRTPHHSDRPCSSPLPSLPFHRASGYHEFDPKLVNTIRSHMPAMPSDSKLPADVMGVVWHHEVMSRLEQLAAKRDTQDEIPVLARYQSVRSRWRKQHYCRKRGDLVVTLSRAYLERKASSAAPSVSIMTVKGREICVSPARTRWMQRGENPWIDVREMRATQAFQSAQQHIPHT